MRRITLWVLSTISALVLLFSYHTSTSSRVSTSIQALGAPNGVNGAGSGGTSTPSPASSSSTPSPSSSSSPSRSSSPSSPSSPSSSSSSSTPSPSGSSGGASAQTVTGGVAQTMWGPVQVQIQVQGSKITSVRVTQIPWNTGRDMQINSYAVPILNQEVIQAQSAQIDMVSGATITSGGYIQSLQSALDKANL